MLNSYSLWEKFLIIFTNEHNFMVIILLWFINSGYSNYKKSKCLGYRMVETKSYFYSLLVLIVIFVLYVYFAFFYSFTIEAYNL
jgi:hypothetical protein